MTLIRLIPAALSLLAWPVWPALAQQDGAAAEPAEATADTVVAVVDGTEITLGHMIVMRMRLPEEYQALPDAVLFDAILEQLVQQQALAAQSDGRLSRGAELALENERRAYVAGERANAIGAAAVTEEAVAAAYAETYASAAPTIEWNAAHILVATEEEARAVKAELDAGADFAELARARSTGPSGANAGELGWFGPGQTVAPFEAAVAALQPGQISEPVQTQFGWHVIRLNETRMKEVPPLEAVRAEIEAGLRRAAIEAAVAEATAAAAIERPGEGLDPALLRRIDLVSD
jgi:peptidyl-prolyl cis-trans isomerase C